MLLEADLKCNGRGRAAPAAGTPPLDTTCATRIGQLPTTIEGGGQPPAKAWIPPHGVWNSDKTKADPTYLKQLTDAGKITTFVYNWIIYLHLVKLKAPSSI